MNYFRTYSKKLFKSLKNHPDFELHFYNEVDRASILKIAKTLESLRLQVSIVIVIFFYLISLFLI